MNIRDTSPCTCHHNDNPPQPCQQKYALTKCRESARLQLLEHVAKLASELCTAVVRESADISGSRPSLTILREIEPLCDKLEGR